MPPSNPSTIASIYNERSTAYDTATFHHRLAEEYMRAAAPSPALMSTISPAARAYAGMLGVARGKAQRTGSRVTFYQHDISDLTDLDLNPNPGGEGEGAGQFDLITCAAALVLLPDPLGAIRSWAEVERVYLSPVFQVKEHKVQQAGELFEQAVSSPMFRNFGVGSIRDQAKRLFDETFVEEAGEEGVLVDEAKMYIGLLSSGDTDVIHEFECYV
ncbi:hypothetical protein GB937_006204 [Aspergillus fischeri]|nr:hypothetical protein GB937_006204 [Aspergillus fischeri]